MPASDYRFLEPSEVLRVGDEYQRDGIGYLDNRGPWQVIMPECVGCVNSDIFKGRRVRPGGF